MTMEFAMLPMMESSFRGATMYAPIPRAESKHTEQEQPKAKRGESQQKRAVKNRSRALYEAYLRHQQTIEAFAARPGASNGRESFISRARRNTIVKSGAEGDELEYQAKARGGHGAGKNKEKCALGVHFPYEMLDIFIGAWCAMTVPHGSEEELAPDLAADVPEGARYLKAALDHPHFAGDVDKLIKNIQKDLKLRGKTDNQRFTFESRIRALKMLLDNTGDKGLRLPGSIWDARRLDRLPPRVWSDEQAAILDAVRRGVAVDDANVNVHSRMLLITGKPGAGKTEAVIGCAVEAAEKGERVLIACPIGALVDTYRQKLPPNDNIVIETVHASHRITRKADQQYIPPGRLRNFDLIIYDEISQLEDVVWQQVRTAIVELNPHPFICFVGDFKQLQPVHGEPELQQTLEDMVQAGTLRHIELQQHELARSNDPNLLDFLSEIRERQPSKDCLGDFFGSRRFAPDKNCKKDPDVLEAVLASKAVEANSGKAFTFLTVTNKGAMKINHTRCLLDFAGREEVVNSELYAAPCDPEYGGKVVAIPGMRIRLTRNIDKERGFVNGALAEVEHVLGAVYIRNAEGHWTNRGHAFIAKTPTGVRLLVHPVRYDGATFMPYIYGYAMTMRRAQGSTLEKVGLWFEHSYPPDRGYAYVGSSRVRSHQDLFLMGKLRRTDWLPVGGGPDDQLRRECDSEDTQSNSDFGSEDQGASDSGSASEDQGASSESGDKEQGGSEDEDQGASDDKDLGASEDEDQGASEDEEQSA
jgi:hypothetical protein